MIFGTLGEAGMHDRPTRIWAVVPVKRLADAKRRLTTVLADRREEFAMLLACRTLDVLNASSMFAGIIVVTPDRQIAAEARTRGCVVLDDAGVSLDAACELGLAAAADRAADVCVLMPSDLATLTGTGVVRVLRQYQRLRRRRGRDSIGLVRCKERTGTNMVILDPAAAFRPAFGRTALRSTCAGLPAVWRN